MLFTGARGTVVHRGVTLSSTVLIQSSLLVLKEVFGIQKLCSSYSQCTLTKLCRKLLHSHVHCTMVEAASYLLK